MFWAQHACLPRSTLVVEHLVWRAYARAEALAHVVDALAESELWLRKLTAQEARHAASRREVVPADEDHALHSGFLRGLIERNASDPQFTAMYADSYARLAVAIGQLRGLGVPAEAWLRAIQRSDVERASLTFSIQLHHRPEGAFIERWRDEPELASRSRPPLEARRVLLPQAPRRSELWQPAGSAPRWLSGQELAEPGALHFGDASGRHAQTLDWLRRAAWQHALGQDRYGVFCEVQIEQMRLRFRYIPPGTFLQGSPEGAVHDDERPQHPVTLTQGLWLAETPCTQALWQAVMGKNPSHFRKGEDAPRRPVDNVSWDDVQTFFKKLQPLLPPDCEAVLPTESQWEYACRAGTSTKYGWGNEPNDARANWGGQHHGTTPVDRYPPNPWGLYDMHGNVWEWCADGLRDYAAEPARDPEGPGAGDIRVVRGGSWFARPGIARAAYRNGGRRGVAGRYRGFRFALRSPVGPEARPGGPGGRRGGAAGGRTAGADAPAAEPPRRPHDDRDTSA